MDDKSVANKEWLRLSEAADYLGVHYTTLRRWSDLEKIPHIKTPGGRRRFRRSDLDRFLNKAQLGQESGIVPRQEGDARPEIIKEIRQMEFAREPWYGQLTLEQRQLMAQSGRRLIGSLIHYVSRTDNEDRYLAQGRELGRNYGEVCLQSGLSFIQTMQTFVNIRHSIVDSLCESGLVVQESGEDTWNIYRRVNYFLDAVMLVILEAFQDLKPPLSQSFE